MSDLTWLTIVHQCGPQMSENGEQFIAINFPHLKNTLKLSKNIGHVLTVYIHLKTNKNIIKKPFVCWFVLIPGVYILFIILGVL